MEGDIPRKPGKRLRCSEIMRSRSISETTSDVDTVEDDDRFEWVSWDVKYLSERYMTPKALGLSSGKHLVVDLGCGTSGMAAEMATRYDRVIGVDIRRDVVDAMTRKYVETKNLSFRHGDITREGVMPSNTVDVVFDKSTFDFLLCQDVSGYIGAIQSMLRESSGVYALVSFYEPALVVPFLNSPGGGFARVEYVRVRVDVHLYVARRSERCVESVEDLRTHQRLVLERFMKNDCKTMVNPERMERMRRAFQGDEPRKTPADAYELIFSVSEREEYTYEYFLQDLGAFEEGRFLPLSASSPKMSLADSVRFLASTE